MADTASYIPERGDAVWIDTVPEAVVREVLQKLNVLLLPSTTATDR